MSLNMILLQPIRVYRLLIIQSHIASILNIKSSYCVSAKFELMEFLCNDNIFKLHNNISSTLTFQS